MLLTIISIGNSQGIRIPKSILKQCHITDKVDMEIEENKIILKPINNIPREGWNEKFSNLHSNQDDKLLINDLLDLNTEEWEW